LWFARLALFGQPIVIRVMKICIKWSANGADAGRGGRGRCILRIGAASVVNGALSIAIKSAGLCLRGNEKSMCCKYEHQRADP
jgi:hypothetical protein